MPTNQSCSNRRYDCNRSRHHAATSNMDGGERLKWNQEGTLVYLYIHSVYWHIATPLTSTVTAFTSAPLSVCTSFFCLFVPNFFDKFNRLCDDDEKKTTTTETHTKSNSYALSKPNSLFDFNLQQKKNPNKQKKPNTFRNLRCDFYPCFVAKIIKLLISFVVTTIKRYNL